MMLGSVPRISASPAQKHELALTQKLRVRCLRSCP
jgi:hypothetical protein